MDVVGVTHATAGIYADIRLQLKRSASPIPTNDMWIAAIALQHGLPILTNDTHFDRIDRVERIAF